ncbi:hypothetical protein SAMN02799631_02244 [Methylobacterium sp. 174MFSha1.1]|uniref:hypothetical protein n=1 Tax=Methylobacterium sp. 174MFSha1.1 TaxID=1502749 RepID=UPI0008F1225D|nr:hypothetical protein [Methylobacterium sp. 174MFSha1.1]SFU78177.1 hypothetical protein SAMN02799631_02244 [Methylobacterium sp. 174MFSha1.1]
MPLNGKLVAQLIFQEIDKLEERCPGYRHEFKETLGDILDYERQHKISATNIQQNINSKCNAMGRFLADRMQKASVQTNDID